MHTTVLCVAMALLAGGGFLSYVDKVSGAGITYTAGVLCLVFAFLPLFKKFKGLGVEAETKETSENKTTALNPKDTERDIAVDAQNFYPADPEPDNSYLDLLSSDSYPSDDAMYEYRRNLSKSDLKEELKERSLYLSFLKDSGVLVGKSLTNTGVLLFTDHPERVLEGAYVKATKFRSKTVTESERMKEIEGPIFTQISGAYSFVESLIKTIDVIPKKGSKAETIYEYPMTCVREVIANAICHRDYKINDRPVHVRIFNNRLEITNPGSWYSVDVPIEEGTPIEKLQIRSRVRNRKLARMLCWLRHVEMQGGGIPKAIKDCEKYGARIPEVCTDDGDVTVTVFPVSKSIHERMESLIDYTYTGEISESKSTYSERLSFLNTRSTGQQRIEALQTIWKNNRNTAYRLILEIPKLELDIAALFLRSCPGWNGEHLSNFLSEHLKRGTSQERLAEWVLEYISQLDDISELSYISYAAIQNHLFSDLDEVFTIYGLPTSSPNIECVRVPPLDFTPKFIIGEETSSDSLAHEVELSPFSIGITPVTKEQYASLSGYMPNGPERFQPVVNVSWWEAWLFCQWLGGDLPTEAQWEFACKSGSQTEWFSGDEEESLKRYAWFDEGVDGDAYPVKQKEPNAWGLYDTHGNVWEWCSDWYAPYLIDKSINPVGPSKGKERVMRGGNSTVPAYMCGSAFRFSQKPKIKNMTTGFRIAFQSE